MSDHWGTPPQPEPHQPSHPAQPEVLTNQPWSGNILGASAEPPKRGSKGKLVAAGVAVVAVAAIGAGAAVAAGALGHDSSQPDKLVPATAVGYVSIDLDPSLGQKVDALRFMRKFPSLKQQLGSTDDIRKWAFEQIATDEPELSDVTYDRDVKPWIGDKFGVAVLPGFEGKADPDAVVVLQVSDEGKAKAGLKKLMSDPDDGVCTVAKGYAVCAEDQKILDAAQAATAKASLADNPRFKADVDSIGKRGIALAWGDLGKITKLVPNPADTLGGAGGLGSGMSGLGVLGSAGQTNGRIVASVRFDGDDLEVAGRLSGFKDVATGGANGTGVENLPNDTLATMGVAVSPKTIDAFYDGFRKGLATGGPSAQAQVEQMLDSMGFHLPQDLKSLVGTKFAIAFGGLAADGTPLVGVRSDADAAKAGKVLDNLSDALTGFGAPFTLNHVSAGQGYAAALDRSYAARLAAGGHLGDQKAFQAAVPDAKSASAVLFVNVAALVDGDTLSGLGSAASDPNLKAVSAVGMSGTTDDDGSGSFTLRVITR